MKAAIALLAPAFLALPLLAAPPLVFEAEAYSSPTAAWLTNRESPSNWNLWGQDTDAEKKWSGGVVLRSPRVAADRNSDAEGAPLLHTRLTGIPPGYYEVTVKHSRALALRWAGQPWTNLLPVNGKLGITNIQNGTLEFDIDDRFATPGSLGTSYYDCVILTPTPAPVAEATAAPRKEKPEVKGWAQSRVTEKFGRGLVALLTPSGSVYLSWRLLQEDGEGMAFHVYRKVGSGKPEKITQAPILKTTDYIDPKPKLAEACSYTVRPVKGNVEGLASAPFTLAARPSPQAYLSFPIQGGSMQKVGIADLDGDGVYDYVLKTPAPNVVDPWGPFWKKSPDTYKIEAYRSTGELLWKRDLGWSIEMGIWYSPYMVWDLDGDGKAEVAVKVGEGDPRDGEGKVNEGPEWCLILDGLTGAEKARIPWPSREGFVDPYRYNYFSRNQLGIAYLDGKTPYLILARGTYNVMKAEAWQFHGGKAVNAWKWANTDEGSNTKLYTGQGAHTMICADVTGDGKDEVILGSCVLDSRGMGLWSTGMGHCDCAYLGKIDPSLPGLQIYYNYETKQNSNGQCLVDAKTGNIIWGLPEPTTHVHAQAMCADIDPFHPGAECYGGERDLAKRWLHTAKGELIADERRFDVGLYRPTLYWDGDLQRELKIGPNIRKYSGRVVNEEPIPGGDDFYVCIADVLGDWREELITYHHGELRIYPTTIPAHDRRVTLMQDPVYRRGVAHNAMGYPQSPMTSTLFDTHSSALGVDLSGSSFRSTTTLTGTVRFAAFGAKAATYQVALKGNEWVTVEPKSLSLTSQPGAVAEGHFTVQLKKRPAFLSGMKQAIISAEVDTGKGTATADGAVDVEEAVPLEKLITAAAGKFSGQGGGEVKVRTQTEKPGTFGPSISHWDKQGHWIEYKMPVPKTGTYLLVLRYAASSEVVRDIRVDAEAITQTFDGTGGFGGAARDWQFATVREARAKRYVLTAGEHVIRLENVDGMGMNLDFLSFIPAGEGD